MTYHTLLSIHNITHVEKVDVLMKRHVKTEIYSSAKSETLWNQGVPAKK